MKRYMFFLLFSAWLLSGSEIKLSRQALPRSNSIRIGDVNITVNRDDSSPSKWTIHARRGAETRKVAVTRGGTDHVWFPDLILEIRNWNIPRNEIWNIMAETIGDYEIRSLTPEEVSAASAVKAEATVRNGKTSVTFSNGHLTFECIPGFNGILSSFRDEASGKELFHANAVNTSIDLKTSQRVGFIELFDSFGKTPEAAMTWSRKGNTLVLSGASMAKNDVILDRTVTLEPDSFAVKIRTAVRPAGKVSRTELTLKHRPEFRMPGQHGTPALNLMLPEKGRLKSVPIETGSAYETKENAYAFSDKDSGILIGIRYENAEQLYVWCDRDYFAAEAFGARKPVNLMPSLTANYFIIHGMARADFIGDNTAAMLPGKMLTGLTGTEIPLEFTYGSAISLTAPVLKLNLCDAAGESIDSKEIRLKKLSAGFSGQIAFPYPVRNIPSGEYVLHLRLLEQGKQLLTGSVPLRLTGKEELEVYRKYLKKINAELSTLRKEFKNSGNKRELMKKFKQQTIFRTSFEEALKSCDTVRMKQLMKQRN